MARTQLKNLWTTVITALLALCTALGLITTAATTAVARTEPARNTATAPQAEPPLLPSWDGTHTRSLPPTMKQRIRAEAHGKSPNCRHRPHTDLSETGTGTVMGTEAESEAEADAPLQR